MTQAPRGGDPPPPTIHGDARQPRLQPRWHNSYPRYRYTSFSSRLTMPRGRLGGRGAETVADLDDNTNAVGACAKKWLHLPSRSQGSSTTTTNRHSNIINSTGSSLGLPLALEEHIQGRSTQPRHL
jgi:hypothetical protein